MSSLPYVVVAMGKGKFFPKGIRHFIRPGKLTMCTVGFGRVYNRKTSELLGTFVFHQGMNSFKEVSQSFHESLAEHHAHVDGNDLKLEIVSVESAPSTKIPANDVRPDLQGDCTAFALGAGCELEFGVALRDTLNLQKSKGLFWREFTIEVDESCKAVIE